MYNFYVAKSSSARRIKNRREEIASKIAMLEAEVRALRIEDEELTVAARVLDRLGSQSDLFGASEAANTALPDDEIMAQAPAPERRHSGAIQDHITRHFVAGVVLTKETVTQYLHSIGVQAKESSVGSTLSRMAKNRLLEKVTQREYRVPEKQSPSVDADGPSVRTPLPTEAERS